MAFFAEFLAGILRSGKALTAAGSVFATGNYVLYKDRNRYRNMATNFSKGNILAPMAGNQYQTKYLPRPQMESKLRRALEPTFTNEYYTISGEVGSGKTRTLVELVQRMMKESEGHGAPIYVSTTQGKDFADSLACAVNFKFDEHVSFKFFVDYLMRIHSFPQRDDHHRLMRVLEAIEKAAFQYVKEHGRPVVIVIDGINSLVRHTPHSLEKLQQKAKLWADTSIVKVVFVYNNEKAEQFLEEHRSNWSRAASPIYVSDFTQDEVIRFLTSTKGDNSTNERPIFLLDEALEIFHLVGGRVHHLVTYIRDREAGKTLEETTHRLKVKERDKFLIPGISLKVIKTMEMIHRCGPKGIKLTKLVELTSEEHIARLLKANILKIEHEGSKIMVTFESKLTENVAKTIGMD